MPLLAISLAFVQFINPQVPPKPDAAKVFATVNGAPIATADVEPYLWDWRSFEVVQDLISLKVLQQAAEKAGVSVTEQEVQDNAQKQLANLDGAKLKAQGFPMSRIIMRITEEMLLDKIVLKDLKASDWVRLSSLTFKSAGKSMMNLGASARKAEVVYEQLKGGASWKRSLKSGEESPSIWSPVSGLPFGVSKDLAAGVYLPPHAVEDGVVITRIDALGASASPAELETLRSDFLMKNREVVRNRISAEAKIVRNQ